MEKTHGAALQKPYEKSRPQIFDSSFVLRVPAWFLVLRLNLQRCLHPEQLKVAGMCKLDKLCVHVWHISHCGVCLPQDVGGACLSEDSRESPHVTASTSRLPHQRPPSSRRPRSRLSSHPSTCVQGLDDFAGQLCLLSARYQPRWLCNIVMSRTAADLAFMRPGSLGSFMTDECRPGFVGIVVLLSCISWALVTGPLRTNWSHLQLCDCDNKCC